MPIASQEAPERAGRSGRGGRVRADPGRGGRAVRIIGSIGGFAALIWAWRHGIRIHLPVNPSWAGAFFGFLVELAILAGLGILTVHLVRVHHRRALKAAARSAKAGAVAAGQMAGHHARRAHAWAGPRWAERMADRDREPADMVPSSPADAVPAPAAEPGDAMAVRIRDAVWAAWCAGDKPEIHVGLVRQEGEAGIYEVAMPLGVVGIPVAGTDGSDLGVPAQMLTAHLGAEAWITHGVVMTSDGQPDHAAITLRVGGTSMPDPMLGRLEQAIPLSWCGELESLQQVVRGRPGLYRAMVSGRCPGARSDAEAASYLSAALGSPVTIRHLIAGRAGLITVIEASGTQTAGAPAPAAEKRKEAPLMTTTPETAPVAPQARAGGVPRSWRAVCQDLADFDPQTDTELLDGLARQVNGLMAFAHALIGLHEHCASAVRLDTAAIAMLHDVSNAAAEGSSLMAQAIERFRQVYEAPREFVANNGVLPKDGDWLTGQG